MILGAPVETFAKLHVGVGLVGIIAGLVAVLAMTSGRLARGVTALFLVATLLTSVTGLLFPLKGLAPFRIVGAVALAVVAAAGYALYVRRLTGAWRAVYVVAAAASLWIMCLVGLAQAFQGIPALELIAPNGDEPPALIAQGATLAVCALLGFLALRNFGRAAPSATPPKA